MSFITPEAGPPDSGFCRSPATSILTLSSEIGAAREAAKAFRGSGAVLLVNHRYPQPPRSSSGLNRSGPRNAFLFNIGQLMNSANWRSVSQNQFLGTKTYSCNCLIQDSIGYRSHIS